MKYIILPLSVVVMSGLIASAFVWDCVRLDRRYAAQLSAVDGELLKHETRLITAVQGMPRVPDDVNAAIEQYRAAGGRKDRHAAYATLKSTTERSLNTSLDPTNPLARRVMDDVAGAINRRSLAEKPYGDAQGQYQAWQNSFRGRVAGNFVGVSN
ncbi:MAG: hypothetical protein KF708_05590 [Pirellulales bacterium]|nr:hypothetical protein [Pirellulales bacterium]